MVTMKSSSPIGSLPSISSRNKSLVSLRESLLDGFLKHNIRNKPQETIPPVVDSLPNRRPARISPYNSGTDLHLQINVPLKEDQQKPKEPSPRPLKKRKIDISGLDITESEHPTPATDAIDPGQCEHTKNSIAIRKRKELAAKLRAGGIKVDLKPSEFARSIFRRNRKATQQPTVIPECPKPTTIDMEIHAKHSYVLYNFVRKGTDLEGFRKCVQDLCGTYHVSQKDSDKSNQSVQQRQPFRCSNRFGESLMHLACRRGRTDMVRFLVEELPGCSPSQMLSVKDDCFKTPLHDACWTASPNFELVELILKHAPEQVLMEDCRGNTPFDYVRKEDYALWLRFLWSRRALLGASHPIATN